MVAIARRWRYYEASILLKSEALISLYLLVVGFLVDYRCGSVGFDLDRIVFFFWVHWWVLMILPPNGWVMIWLDWVSGWVGDEWIWDWMGFRLSGLVSLMMLVGW